MGVAGHRVFPVLVLWLLVQLTYSGADAMGYSWVRCGRYTLQQPFTVMAQGSVTVQWCLDFCATNNQPSNYGALRRLGGGNAQAACYCVTLSGIPGYNNATCGWKCGGGLQCGGTNRGSSHISVYKDVNECLTNNGGCEQTCVNSPGSFSCQCREGYNEVGAHCTDIDECDTDNGCAQHCTNTQGSYICSCDDGYIVNNTTCHDINECAIDSGGCDHTCTNTPGGYNCSCLDGYVSDNTTCTDIDECADPAIHNCSPTDECRNTNGSFQCLPKAVDTTVSSTVTEIEGIVCRPSTAPPVWMYALLGILMAVVIAMGVVIFMLWRRRAGTNNTNNTATAPRPLGPHPGSERAVSKSPAVVSWEDRPTDPEVSGSQYEHIKIYTNSEAAQGVYEKVE